jgi:hypothetical protein
MTKAHIRMNGGLFDSERIYNRPGFRVVKQWSCRYQNCIAQWSGGAAGIRGRFPP